jgi:hypothetical protein
MKSNERSRKEWKIMNSREKEGKQKWTIEKKKEQHNEQ